MATSGSVDWTLSRNQIIRQAALEVNAISSGITMGAQMLSDFDVKLNAMVKALQASGIHVWTVREGVLFPQVAQRQYGIGGSSTDFVASTYTQTALGAAAASAATSLTVDSITGISNADNLGVVVDDGTLHWDTVNGVPAGSTVTITTGLDDSASEDAAVFAYTSNIVRPLKIVSGRRYNLLDGRETPLDMMARMDYLNLPNKTQSGTTTGYFYDAQLSTGQMYIWPVPTAVEDIIKFTWHRPIEDFDSAGDNPDLPQEWILALIFNLAETQLAQFPVSDRQGNRVVYLAQKYLDVVSGFDREEGSIYMQPDMGY